ncbi:group III truncated hemoglobin [Roseovarius sp. SCSIO 43702]|uniref:group III truncated hemoglobin n=1 Tax=Roseovarius sp. SCSIO 43702 TaxID=2823043 RepID=UPI001C72E371|nr:group III truncated hemoglobin [Roseovarius sp. SCSIO 43702]QYX56690.1 group III truncated hemoglobin [Roseovarius sp. SCSIO 43702]
MANPLALFEITPEEIDRVVTSFYARIRKHPDLGPVFAAHIADDEWPAHEEKIARFWRNAILRERSYSGNPMRIHMEARDVQPEHFPLWLGLFDEVLSEELDPRTARSFSALAHRIGDGFIFGLTQMRRPRDEPPILR